MKLRKWKPPERYMRSELASLIERVQLCDVDAIEEAVAFAVHESFGLWHGRARAKICRNLKNRSVPRGFQDLLVQAICRRLITGNFAEQFKDQLEMAIRFHPLEMEHCARQALESPKCHVQRYGKWVLDKLSRLPR